MKGLMESLRQKPLVPLVSVLVLALLAIIPAFASPFVVILLTSAFMYMALCLCWNVFCGPAKYVSLATAAFFGIGVYTSAIFSELPLPLVMLIAGVFSCVLGLVLGSTTLRLKGMYFAIFTFGLNELIRQTMIWYEVNVTGTVGRWLPLESQKTVYYYLLGVVAVTLLAASLLTRSRWGLALRSIGESEEAAAHIGIHVNMVKILTFAGTCFFMGVTGAIVAKRWSYIDPDLAYAPFVTFFEVMMVLVGGIDSTLFGPLLGATVLTVLSDVVLAPYPRLTMLLFGALLILVIVFLRHGLISLLPHKRRPAVVCDEGALGAVGRGLAAKTKAE